MAKTFLQIYNATLRAMGFDPAVANPGTAFEEAVADAINNRTRQGFEFAWWPTLTLVESRSIAESGDIRYLPLTATGKTDIGEVRAVYESDPRSDATPNLLPFVMDALGIIPDETGVSTTPTALYVEFRKAPPAFTRTAYAAGTTYAVGEIVYYATSGECYVCIQSGAGKTPSSQPTYWTRLEFPEFFYDYVRWGAAGDWLLMNRQEEGAKGCLALAEQEIMRLRDVKRGQQGGYTRASVIPYT